MNIEIIPSKLRGTVDAIPSKSAAHRKIICAALSDKPCEIEISSLSKDIEATITVLGALGASFDYTNQILKITPLDRSNLPKKAVLDCCESGSTLRFMFPVVCALGIEGFFKVSGRLASRPMSPLFNLLNQKGIETKNDAEGFYCKGTLESGDFLIEGNISSQYISGLLFALPLLKGKSRVILSTPLESAPYVKLTCDILNESGIEVVEIDSPPFGGFEITNSDYHTLNSKVEGDWSNACFWLVAGVKVKGLSLDSAQGDKAILNIIEKMGGVASTDDDIVSVKVDNLHSTEVDASDIPDAVPVLSVLASTAFGNTVIKNISRLRLKESDRVATVCGMLKALGIKTESNENSITIFGGQLEGGTVDCANDHRIAMSAAVASVFSKKPVILMGAEAVNKSYPNFFEHFERLGGKIHVL